VLAAAVFIGGTLRVWRRAGPGRGVHGRDLAFWWAGLTTLLVALVGPVDGLADRSVAAHMAQHLMLLVVAPALLALARPRVAVSFVLPRSLLRRASKLARYGSVGVVGALHALVLWVWHVPAAWNAALAHTSLHMLEHASFFGAGLAFWMVLATAGRSGARGYALALSLTFATAAQAAILGVLLSFAGSPWYDGATLNEQRAAGALMWGPGGLAYALAGAILLTLGLKAMERTPTSSSLFERGEAA
jgi:putative membrane protein